MTLTVLPPSGDAVRSVRPDPMTVVVRIGRTRTVVVVRGEADFSTTPALSDALSRVSALGAGDVVVDLGELQFIDCAGARVLAAAQGLLVRGGRKLMFRSPSRLVARVLDFFELTDLIETREEDQP